MSGKRADPQKIYVFEQNFKSGFYVLPGSLLSCESMHKSNGHNKRFWRRTRKAKHFFFTAPLLTRINYWNICPVHINLSFKFSSFHHGFLWQYFSQLLFTRSLNFIRHPNSCFVTSLKQMLVLVLFHSLSMLLCCWLLWINIGMSVASWQSQFL